jgi:hypothetical protein
VATFLEKHPDNPAALAEQTILLAETEGGRRAVGTLQRSLSLVDEHVPDQTYEAIGVVGQALLAEGEIAAARAHLLLQAHLSDQDDARALETLVQLAADQRIPSLLKEGPELSRCADGVAWKRTFDGAVNVALRGAWSKAAETFERVVEPSGSAPEVWWNLALVRMCQADTEGAVAALRTFSSLDVPLDDAVEAEALAQLHDPNARPLMIDTLRLVYPIRDIEAVDARLASDRRAAQQAVDSTTRAGEDEPLPTKAYLLLDRPVPETGVGLSRDAIPRAVAILHVYSAQADLPARLELVTNRNSRFAETVAAVHEMCGDGVGQIMGEDVLSQVPASTDELQVRCLFPSDTPPELRRDLLSEERREVLFGKWPHLPLAALDGKTPAEAAEDERLRIRTLAAILLLDKGTNRDGESALNQLRSQLGLPVAEPIDPTGLELDRLPLARFPRLMVDKLSDDDVMRQFSRALAAGVLDAARTLAQEVVQRDDRLPNTQAKSNAFGLMADRATESDQQLALIERGRQITAASGKSSAQWDVRELALRIDRGEAHGAQKLLQHIASEHSEEPGVKESVANILLAAGLIRPDGTPVGPRPSAEPSRIIVPGAAGGQPGGIWTPDKGEDGGEKRKIWTPAEP